MMGRASISRVIVIWLNGHFFAVLALLVTLTSAESGVVAEPIRPNIVFIFSDDHAVQAIGAYGSKINETPNIDRIAREGAIFTQSFCANSLCGPSRACILTGKHSHLNGFLRNGNRFDPKQTTFPPLLQAAGYQTAIIGKWHLGTQPVGFDFWQTLPDQGSYYNPDFIQMNGVRKNYPGYCTDIITDLSIEWLQQGRDPNKPFMLMCQHKAPHRNWAPAERHFHLYDNRHVPHPKTMDDDYAGRSKLLKENEMSLRKHLHWGHDMKFHGKNQYPKCFVDVHPNGEYDRMTDVQKKAWDAYYQPQNDAFLQKMADNALTDEEILDWKYQRYVTDYLKCVQAVDDGVGRILDYLEESGLTENTVVIYCSDQGFYLGEHGWYDKRWMFEESLRMPFVIRWPKTIVPGTTSRTLIQNIDYAATFLDLAGASVPKEMQGRSLVPVLHNDCQPTPDWRDAIYYAYYENAAVHEVPVHDGLRTDRYKLMFFPRTREWQLFDLQADPDELQSLHQQAEYAKILEGMQKRYRDLRMFYEVNSAIIPATRGDEDWWRDRHQATNELAQLGTAELAFIGDSITQGWETTGKEVWDKHYSDRKPINLGFSGDRTEHVIWRLQDGNLANIRPKVAVVMIGTNNTGHAMQDPQQVADGVHRILKIVAERSPDTKTLLLGVFPRGERPMDLDRLNNIAINQIIRQFDDGERVFYHNLSHVFLDKDEMISKDIMPDFLHLSPRGYQLWAESMESKLQELGIPRLPQSDSFEGP